MKDRLKNPAARPMPEQDPKSEGAELRRVPRVLPRDAKTKHCGASSARPYMRRGFPLCRWISPFIAKVAEGSSSVRRGTSSRPSACLPSAEGLPPGGQCEQRCVRAKKGHPVPLVRSSGSLRTSSGPPVMLRSRAPATPTGKKVAIVGSGPSGLTVGATCAARPRRHHLRGAAQAWRRPRLRHPEFRLPKAMRCRRGGLPPEARRERSTPPSWWARPPPWTSSSRKGMTPSTSTGAGLPSS